MFTKARIAGFMADPEALARKVISLETEIGRIQEKEARITNAARLHRRQHYLLQHRYCNCEVCVALGE